MNLLELQTPALVAGVLRDRYPRWEDFAAVRKRCDPDGMFRNAYTDRVLGTP